MKAHEQNATIAETIGIERTTYFRKEVWVYDGQMHHTPPDFMNDLNRCRMFEQWAERQGVLADYGEQLTYICGVAAPYTNADIGDIAAMSAAHKCKAFLATVGK